MEKIIAAIEIDGEISVGEVVAGTAEIGEVVTIRLQDENGNFITQTGPVVEIL